MRFAFRLSVKLRKKLQPWLKMPGTGFSSFSNFILKICLGFRRFLKFSTNYTILDHSHTAQCGLLQYRIILIWYSGYSSYTIESFFYGTIVGLFLQYWIILIR
jgi:hypothetical protein